MWAWYFFSFGISSKKIWDEPVHFKLLISSVWKLMPNPVDPDFMCLIRANYRAEKISTVVSFE